MSMDRCQCGRLVDTDIDCQAYDCTCSQCRDSMDDTKIRRLELALQSAILCLQHVIKRDETVRDFEDRSRTPKESAEFCLHELALAGFVDIRELV